MPASLLSIGELSRRTGASVSAIRFYETQGLVKAIRTTGNQRRFMRADIRRLSFALIAQRLGLTLTEIEAELATLPQGRAPTRQDWQAISGRIRGALQARIGKVRSRYATSPAARLTATVATPHSAECHSRPITRIPMIAFADPSTTVSSAKRANRSVPCRTPPRM